MTAPSRKPQEFRKRLIFHTICSSSSVSVKVAARGDRRRLEGPRRAARMQTLGAGHPDRYPVLPVEAVPRCRVRCGGDGRDAI